MKRIIVIIILLLAAAGAVACAWIASENETVHAGRAVGLSLRGAKVLFSRDTHGGFHGDGARMISLDCSDLDMASELENAKHWKPLPPTENVFRLLWGDGVPGHEASTWTRIGDEDGGMTDEPFFPRIENGFWFFKDRSSQAKQGEIYSDEHVFERYSVNFTVAVYDADSGILYYYELDT